jgi:Transposase
MWFRLLAMSLLFSNACQAVALPKYETEPLDVTYCRLAGDPTKFSGKRIRIQAIYSYMFEVSALRPPTCCAEHDIMKAYLLKESLERLRTYRYEGAMLRYLQSWIDQLRWQRLAPFQKLAFMLLDHPDGILNYCRTKVPFGVVEDINGNIKTLLRRGRGYKNLAYLLLKAQRMAATKTEFIVLQKAA